MSEQDVRSYFAALGIQLPDWSKREAPVRCFAQPGEHKRGDRSPSCSVNLWSGAWNCHGCGARGGAYDAALAVGCTPRFAMELLITHGLAERRTAKSRRLHPRTRQLPSPANAHRATSRAALQCNESDITRWGEALAGDGRLVRRLMHARAWAPRVMRELQLGVDGSRITIPVRSATGCLRGVLRYDPFGEPRLKMRAAVGTRLGLIPHPSREVSGHILLVEGPPDMIAARSVGLPAIAVPGTHAWQPTWGALFEGRRVTIVMDCDAAGRGAAVKIAAGLRSQARAVDIVDLSPTRSDGFDLTDFIVERGWVWTGRTDNVGSLGTSA